MINPHGVRGTGREFPALGIELGCWGTSPEFVFAGNTLGRGTFVRGLLSGTLGATRGRVFLYDGVPWDMKQT